MTIDDYKRNLRGVNDGSDFSAEFLVRSDLFLPELYSRRPSKISTTRFANEKLLCQKNIRDSLGLNTPGRNFLLAQGKQAGLFLCAIFLELNINVLSSRRLSDLQHRRI